MGSPRVSVVITLYNKGPFVEEAVGSVLQGSFRDIEVLVVDDGSTDDGPQRVSGIRDPRLRLLPWPVNTGRAAAANRGFDAARGEYIAVLDADDVAMPERLARQVAHMDAHPELGASGTAAQLMGARHEVVRWPADHGTAMGLLLFEDPMLYGSCIFRKASLRAHGLRCPEDWRWPGMDYLFLLRVAFQLRVGNLQEPLTAYRLGEHNFRHGRDRHADSARIVAEALRLSGIGADAQEIQAHLALLRRQRELPDADGARRLKAWAGKLKRLNRAQQRFTPTVFEARLDAELSHWFHVLAEKRPLAALPLLFTGGGRAAIKRLLYWMRARLH